MGQRATLAPRTKIFVYLKFLLIPPPPPPQKKYATIQTNVYHAYDTWGMNLRELIEYGPKTNKENSFDLVVVDSLKTLNGQRH